jgi:hypothetical protein
MKAQEAAADAGDCGQAEHWAWFKPRCDAIMTTHGTVVTISLPDVFTPALLLFILLSFRFSAALQRHHDLTRKL